MDAILDATAHLLESAPEADISTNHIAKRAGISIGTLYQYYPNKAAVLIALADRGNRTLAGNITGRINIVDADSVEDITHQVISALISVMIDTPGSTQLARLVQIQHLQGLRDQPLTQSIANLIAEKLHTVRNVPKEQSTTVAFVLTRAILCTIRSALQEDPEMLASKDFELQMIRLASSYIDAQ